MTPIELPDKHPGRSDPAYLARRSHIAAASTMHPSGTPPRIDYTPAEDQVWRTVSGVLQRLHADAATHDYQLGTAALALPDEHVPQLADVSIRLGELTGWRIRAVPGLVPTREFYGALAERTFLSTQYVRHPSVPFYTPEPDVIHEVIGHGNGLASPRLARLYELAGRASTRAVDDAALERFSKVFWFTMEFGLVREAGGLRIYGAGLLSSCGELQSFAEAEIRPFDLEEMANRDYDITQYQRTLYAAESFDDVVTQLSAWFEAF